MERSLGRGNLVGERELSASLCMSQVRVSLNMLETNSHYPLKIDILQRQQFILKLAKALLIFGSPSHRLESQLLATAKVLEVEAQFIHLPSIVIASFGDADTHTSETHFVKSSGALNLGSLHAVHELYRKVVHDEVSVEEGSVELSRILRAPPIYSLWYRVIFSALLAGVIAPFG